MSAACRAGAEKLRKTYAARFHVDLSLVHVHEWPGDDAKVWCPSRPDLPTWTTGELQGMPTAVPVVSKRKRRRA